MSFCRKNTEKGREEKKKKRTKLVTSKKKERKRENLSENEIIFNWDDDWQKGA
jgi:hypothetical protein